MTSLLSHLHMKYAVIMLLTLRHYNSTPVRNLKAGAKSGCEIQKIEILPYFEQGLPLPRSVAADVCKLGGGSSCKFRHQKSRVAKIFRPYELTGTLQNATAHTGITQHATLCQPRAWYRMRKCSQLGTQASVNRPSKRGSAYTFNALHINNSSLRIRLITMPFNNFTLQLADKSYRQNPMVH